MAGSNDITFTRLGMLALALLALLLLPRPRGRALEEEVVGPGQPAARCSPRSIPSPVPNRRRGQRAWASPCPCCRSPSDRRATSCLPRKTGRGQRGESTSYVSRREKLRARERAGIVQVDGAHRQTSQAAAPSPTTGPALKRSERREQLALGGPISSPAAGAAQSFWHHSGTKQRIQNPE